MIRHRLNDKALRNKIKQTRLVLCTLGVDWRGQRVDSPRIGW